MNNRFLNVNAITGELKRTELRRGVGYRLTTKEFILLREDVSYHIFLDDILGVISREEEGDSLPHTEAYGDTQVTHHFGVPSYKIVAMKMRLYNRSGVFEKGASTLYTQLSAEFTQQMIALLQGSAKNGL